MKSFLYTFLFMGLSLPLFSQILNDAINYEVQTSRLWSDVPITLDLFSFEDVRMEVLVADNHNGVLETVNPCFFFETNGPEYQNDHNKSLVSVIGVPLNTELSFALSGWEHNNIPTCEYNGDDQFLISYVVEDYINNPVIVGAGRPMAQWSDDWSTLPGEWLLPNGILYPFNMVLRTTWRYSFGESLDQPIEFGTIGTGEVRYHTNSNRYAPLGADDSRMGYSDTEYDPSPDVYYSFTITESSNVIISTTITGTNFDTWIRLLDENGELIDEDNNSGEIVWGGPAGSSALSLPLCAGTYHVVVEGHDGAIGDFGLQVIAESSVGQIFINSSAEYPECPGEAGTITVNPTGGVPPYTFDFANGQGETGNNVGIVQWGLSFGVIYDACGNDRIFEIEMDIANDQTPPIAVCDALSFTLDPGQTINLDDNNFGFNSTDNCGITSYTITPSSFSYDNVGINNVTLVVADESGIESTCTGTVEIIQNTTTSSLDLVQALSFSMNPNPASDYLQIGLTGVNLSLYSQVSILTITGQEVWTKQTNEDQTIDLSNFPRGLYLVRVQDGDKAGTRKLVIQ